jgi:hypothetical protein
VVAADAAAGATAAAATAIASVIVPLTAIETGPRSDACQPFPILRRRMDYAVAIVILALVAAAIVAAPLRRGPDVDRREDERRAGLEAAKEAKYREIRDAELDYRMGKMSEPDYRETDRELRAQAVTILRDLDELDAERR